MRFSIALACAALCTVPAFAQDLFPRGVTIQVAGTAGGGIDLYARFLGRHLGRNIPGNPVVNVQDMPGAGGIRAANYMAEQAPKDGSVLATFPGGPLIEPLVGARNPGYDMSQFQWIGAMSRDVSLCISWKDGPFQTLEDTKKQEFIVAGTGAGSETDSLPLALNAVLGTKMRVITGYLGTKETFMAIESGEAHGRCAMTLSSLRASKPDWIRDNKINMLLQLGMEKNTGIGDVPFALDLVSKAEDRQMLELLMIGTVLGRPFAAPPGTPPARVEILRKAFDATMKDPVFLEEAVKTQSDITPTSGAQVQQILARTYATPKAVTDRVKALMQAGGK